MASPFTEVEVGDRIVKVTNPDRVYFSARGETKLDLVHYYLAVGEGIVRALHERPCMLQRFPEGAEGEKIYQKRVPVSHPDWLQTVRVKFPSRPARRRAVRHRARRRRSGRADVDVEFHPWHSAAGRHRAPGRAAHRPRPPARHRLRRRAPRRAEVVHEHARRARLGRLAEDLRQPRACTSTCGSSRRTASPTYAAPRSPSPVRSSAGHPSSSPPSGGRRSAASRVFVDYNQNARDRTIASAYSVRARPTPGCRRR